ncbi:MAG: hypothetical protein HRT67_12180 [Flavobacteriaceae bacterium]|nr:hypothetical protein [Flavobacteriaceae bacterium]
MKKKLESELISIAHRILKLKGKEDVNQMHTEVTRLYEKLTVLKFAKENFEEQMPTIGNTIGNDSSFFGMLDTAFNNTISDNIEVENKVYVNMDTVEDDGIMEPVMEKIKDIVAQMPEESQQVDLLFEEAEPKVERIKNDFEDITADFAEMPIFEPVSEAKEPPQKSLNDRLKSPSFNIGLNDKLAFIKHLFDGSSEDYERVLSQLKTSMNFLEARTLIQNIIKPDYNHWQGKEDYEERFMTIVENKFN